MNRTVLMMLFGLAWAASTGAHPAAPADPLEARVTIDYRSTPAADVIRSLAAAAGLTVEIGAGTLRPVTITLTNVKLGTALNAICENAPRPQKSSTFCATCCNVRGTSTLSAACA